MPHPHLSTSKTTNNIKPMKQKLRLIMMTLLCAVFSSAWADDDDYFVSSTKSAFQLYATSKDSLQAKAMERSTSSIAFALQKAGKSDPQYFRQHSPL